MEDYKSDMAKLFEKRFRKINPTDQIDAITSYNKSISKSKNKDTRHHALKELDIYRDEVLRNLPYEKGKFNPDTELKRELELEKDIETDEKIPQDRKLEYLRILRKRMRTA